MTDPNPEIPPVVEPAADAVPVPDPVPDPPSDPAPEEHHDEMPSWAESMANRIIDAINTVKEASPVTPVEEDVLDKSPVKPPWTHRRPFGRKD